MPLQRGTNLGSYEVGEALGAGGMGEVYRARDTRLKRDVAIKVLPASFANDPERLARLQREAEVLASLNHPRIAQIHGLEEIDGTTALVMELVDGPTLADRLVHGPIPLDEALPLALQIAEGLEAAHERGVVHRDLKPSNIKIRTDGTIKVLDFGLAKAMDHVSDAGLSRTPTITTPAMTQAGVILGTAAYMSPEQARGVAVDKRTDVWAFGVVLYEMISGRRLFDEPTVSETIAAVLKGGIELSGVPHDTPLAITNLLGRCVTRDVRRRLRDIGEARLIIEDAIAHPQGPAASGSRDLTLPVGQKMWRLLPRGMTAIAAAAALVLAWAPWRTGTPDAPVTRVITDVGLELRELNTGSRAVLSPNGRLLVIVGEPRPGGRQRLFIRPLDQMQASALPGTDGARNPFFSPDSRWVAFFADGKLKKVPVTGGAAVTLSDAPDDRGGSWSENGWIAFSPRSGESPLFRVSSDGGASQPLTKLEDGEITHRWPQVLPGETVLYTAHTATGAYESATLVAYSIKTGQRKVIHRGGYYARYLPTGHILYASQDKLFAVGFDINGLKVDGQAWPVLSDARTNQGTGLAHFTFAQNGTFAYVVRDDADAGLALRWMARDGKTQPARNGTAEYSPRLRFSPDGERLGVAIKETQSDIWLYEWKRDAMVRLTTDEALDVDPIWSPDGRRVTFRSARFGVDNIFWQRADGTGDVQRLTESKVVQFPMSWHPSGKFLAYREFGQQTRSDIWILPMEGDDASGWKPGKPTIFAGSRFDETDAMFSPDGRWIAFQSNESGADEIYVSPFPASGGRVQVSVAGGTSPAWSRATKELFFKNTDNQIMVAGYTIEGNAFHADKPRLVSGVAVTGFDVHPDGQRLAVLLAPPVASSSSAGKLVFIFNFFDEIRRLGQQAGR